MAVVISVANQLPKPVEGEATGYRSRMPTNCPAPLSVILCQHRHLILLEQSQGEQQDHRD